MKGEVSLQQAGAVGAGGPGAGPQLVGDPERFFNTESIQAFAPVVAFGALFGVPVDGAAFAHPMMISSARGTVKNLLGGAAASLCTANILSCRA